MRPRGHADGGRAIVVVATTRPGLEVRPGKQYTSVARSKTTSCSRTSPCAQHFDRATTWTWIVVARLRQRPCNGNTRIPVRADERRRDRDRQHGFVRIRQPPPARSARSMTKSRRTSPASTSAVPTSRCHRCHGPRRSRRPRRCPARVHRRCRRRRATARMARSRRCPPRLPSGNRSASR